MANQIRLKRASGSDPGASDLVTGEIAVRTDTGKLFTKKDDGSVAEISGGGGIDDGDKGDITVSSSGATFTIDNGVVSTAKIADDAVTFDKLENVENNRILGRVSSGAGNAEELTQSQVRTLLNVENGATADQTASEIVALIADQTIAPSTIDMEDNEKIQLGTGDDLQIFHDGSQSVIKDNGTGQLLISGENTIALTNADASENYARFLKDGAVELFHNNNKKFETSSSGGTLTGTLVADAFTGPLTGNVTGNASGSSGSCTGNAATATALETARTIAGVSFDGTANISLNNNAITNGAGYITATLTNEQVQDIVGGMVTGNTETGITVTYQDGDGTIDFVVGTLNQDTTGNAATATALETARNIGGVSFDGTGNINLPGVNTSGNQDTSGNAATATKLATARNIAGVSFDGSANISLNNNAITNGAGYITDVVDDTSPQLGGDLQSNGNDIDFADDDKAIFGTGGDLEVYHDGSNSYIKDGGTGSLLIRGSTVSIQSTSGEAMIEGVADGAVTIKHNNSTKFVTSSSGISITGNIVVSGTVDGRDLATDGSKLDGISSGANVGIAASGGEFTGDITVHDVIPDGNNTRDLGSSSKRFANLYVNDMHFANSPENLNKVDGTWGDWTLQEGEETIYMLNNRNGKKYKMNLTEIV